MFQLKLLNPIDPSGLDLLTSDYVIDSDRQSPDAVLLRSYDMLQMDLPASLCVVGRAGAGVNNIPVLDCSARGIPVLNTPGANANAVKELVVAGMLIASRHLCAAWRYTQQLKVDDNLQLEEAVEQSKQSFKGQELAGKTLVVLGLGKVGVMVANIGVALGMRVVGIDSCISLENAWQLSSQVEKAEDLNRALAQADFISLHVPLLGTTKDMIGVRQLDWVKPSAVLLNFSRGGIVDEKALLVALDQEKLAAYVTDFPSLELRHHQRVIALPHLGASTSEAESNCSKMIVAQVRDYLELGHIRHSVNFPDAYLGPISYFRLAIAHKNVQDILAIISSLISDHDINITDMINKSRDCLAYTLVDIESKPSSVLIDSIRQCDEVYHVRCIAKK